MKWLPVLYVECVTRHSSAIIVAEQHVRNASTRIDGGAAAAIYLPQHTTSTFEGRRFQLLAYSSWRLP